MKKTTFKLKSLKPLRYFLVIVSSLVFVTTSASLTHAAPAPLPDPTPPAATANTDEVKAGLGQVGGNEAGNNGNALTGIIKNVIDILLFLVGTISVLMIIIGGIRYSTSNGDQAQVTSAKNTVLYSVVGVVVALMAYALVNFIVERI